MFLVNWCLCRKSKPRNPTVNAESIVTVESMVDPELMVNTKSIVNPELTVYTEPIVDRIPKTTSRVTFNLPAESDVPDKRNGHVKASASQVPKGFRPGTPWHTPFLREHVMFGRFPFQEEVEMLQYYGITHFLNLTQANEEYKGMKLEPYIAKKQISFPILEQNIPNDDDAFIDCMSSIRDIIRQGGKVYIHCKHGRGRSAMVAMIILAISFDLNTDRSVIEINEGHWLGHGGNHFKNKIIPPHTIQMEFAETFLDRWYKMEEYKLLEGKSLN